MCAVALDHVDSDHEVVRALSCVLNNASAQVFRKPKKQSVVFACVVMMCVNFSFPPLVPRLYAWSVSHAATSPRCFTVLSLETVLFLGQVEVTEVLGSGKAESIKNSLKETAVYIRGW